MEINRLRNVHNIRAMPNVCRSNNTSKNKKSIHRNNGWKNRSSGSVLNLFKDHKFNHTVELEYGILEEESKKILQDFFKKLRKRNNGGKCGKGTEI